MEFNTGNQKVDSPVRPNNPTISKSSGIFSDSQIQRQHLQMSKQSQDQRSAPTDHSTIRTDTKLTKNPAMTVDSVVVPVVMEATDRIIAKNPNSKHIATLVDCSFVYPMSTLGLRLTSRILHDPNVRRNNEFPP